MRNATSKHPALAIAATARLGLALAAACLCQLMVVLDISVVNVAQRDPREVAADIGGRGAMTLKRVVTEAVNERLRPVRSLRNTLIQDRTGLREVLMAGTERARAMAADTLASVRQLMHTTY